MSGLFKRAQRRNLFARIAIDGPTGSGKTLTGLMWAFALAGPKGVVAVIDTEHRSASKYVGQVHDGRRFEFEVCELLHYAPSTYSQAIKEAARMGANALLIDSLSHGWEGVGGTLDQVDRKASKVAGGSYGAWREVSPMHREMIETILGAPMHIIATMRSKMQYAMEEGERDGKKKTIVTKVGLKPIQREGVEYEFDLVGDMDVEHMLTISKTRCPAMDELRVVKPNGTTIQPFIDWLNEGEVEAIETQAATHLESAAADPGSHTAAPSRAHTPTADGGPGSANTGPQEGSGGGIRLSGTIEPNPYEQQSGERCMPDQKEKIIALAKHAGMPPEALKAALAKRGVNRINDLTNVQAQQLIAKLEAKVFEKEADDIPF